MRRLFLVSTDPGNPTYERCPLTRDFQDSLGFCILRRGFQIPGTGFQSLSVELRSWIPIVSGIPESLSCIPDSKTQDSRFLNQNFRPFRIPLHEGIRKVPAYKRFPGWQFGVCWWEVSVKEHSIVTLFVVQNFLKGTLGFFWMWIFATIHYHRMEVFFLGGGGGWGLGGWAA